MANETHFKPYSLGIVVENKPRGTDIVLVSPIEELNIQPHGSIKEQQSNYSGNRKDLSNQPFKTEHSSKNYIRAKWVPYGESNRLTAPDVYANETVMIYKFGDVDEYYWCDVMREPELRRLEDVMYAYSNVKSGTNAYDKNTSYWVRYNTRDKYVHLHTAKNDGEPFIYDLKIDAAAGVVSVRDDVGNFIELNSSTNTISLKSLSVINLEAGKDVNIKAGSSINLSAPSIKESAGNSLTMSAGSSISLSAPSISESANSKSSSAGGASVGMSGGSVVTQAPGGITNNTPIVRNSGNVETAGSDLAHPNLNAVIRS